MAMVKLVARLNPPMRHCSGPIATKIGEYNYVLQTPHTLCYNSPFNAISTIDGTITAIRNSAVTSSEH